jgi:prepilin-type N-terminal cleavage/methylation domain-containing protein
MPTLSFRARRGLTLVELLVVLAILGIVLTLLVSAIQRVREAANIADSKNNLRQIVVGVHNFAATQGDRLPMLGQMPDRRGKFHPSIFTQLLPYVENQPVPVRNMFESPQVPLYLSPADPTLRAAVKKKAAVSSYAANAEVFTDNPRLSTTFTDGASNTIMFAEHYAADCRGIYFPYWNPYLTGGWYDMFRPSFADFSNMKPFLAKSEYWPNGVVPTFQTAPKIGDCLPTLPQTPHPSGMLIALADGSVRQVAPSISPSTFWAAVTPKGGEVLGRDW